MDTLEQYGFLEQQETEPGVTVYKAYDSAHQRHVEIRTFGPDIQWNESLRDRFSAECRTLAALEHPNVARIFDYGIDAGRGFMVLEWLQGKDLRTLIAEHALMPVERKIAVMLQAASALGHAHGLGIRHRNLEPGNIHILPDGTVKLTNFDVGCLPPHAPVLSVTGRKSSAYLSPEQLQGLDIAPPSEVFSLGLIFYEFVTGMHPFHDADSGKVRENILQLTHFPTVEQFPEFPMNLWPILEKCLAKDPEERFSGPAEIVAASRQLLAELAEDSELMRIELQAAAPRLRHAARKHGAEPGLAVLANEVDQALRGRTAPDYQTLNRLLTSLAEYHDLLLSATDPGCISLTAIEESGPRNEDSAIPSGDVPAAMAQPLPIQPPVPQDAFMQAHKQVKEPPQPRGSEAAPEGPPSPSPVAASARAAAESSQSKRPLAQDLVYELLRNIDQGQDLIRKAAEPSLKGSSEPMPAEERTNPVAASPGPPTSGVGREPFRPKQERSAARSAIEPRAAMAPPRAARVRAQGEFPDSPGAPRGEAIPARPARSSWNLKRTNLWICAAALLLALAIAVPSWMRNRPETGATQVRSVLPPPAASGVLSPMGAESMDPGLAGDRLLSERRNILLDEARALSAAGRNADSRIFLQRLLETDPDFAPAIDELARIERESAPVKEPDPASQQVKTLLASASTAIRNGKLDKAKADLDKAELLRPGGSEVVSLRKRLEAKNAELARNLASEQARQQEAARRQKAGETLTREIETFYRQGNYDAALRVADGQLAQDPQLAVAQDLRNRTAELQQNLKAYEAALAARRYPEAALALEHVGRLNPNDPNLPELRRRAESGSEPGSATLSIYPISDRGQLMFDDQPIGNNGELVNQSVPAGKHKLSVRGGSGLEIISNQTFANGQQASLIYDLSKQAVRPMTDADRDRMRKNKAKEQVYRFAVEHTHGLFRGSCKGELVVNYYDVVFRPGSGSHGFNLPFKILQLRIEDRTAVIEFATDGKEMSSFKLQDPQSAQALLRTWGELKAIDR